METNKMNEVIETCSGIILKKDFEFPEDLTMKMKSKLISILLEEFQKMEDYEKCAKLKKKFSSILKKDENNRSKK